MIPLFATRLINGPDMKMIFSYSSSCKDETGGTGTDSSIDTSPIEDCAVPISLVLGRSWIDFSPK